MGGGGGGMEGHGSGSVRLAWQSGRRMIDHMSSPRKEQRGDGEVRPALTTVSTLVPTPTGKCSLHPVSRTLVTAAHGDHRGKPQPIKMQSGGAQFSWIKRL